MTIQKTIQKRARKAIVRKRARKQRRTGYLLYESPNHVVIATGINGSSNPKTGNMVQIWILNRDISPIDAIKTGQDDVVCFDCKHRPKLNQDTGVRGERTCYVVMRAPQSVWRAYRRGRYELLSIDRYAEVFSGRKIRFGAYGDPVLIPLPIVRELARVSAGRTGYTHQYEQPEYQEYSEFLMASADSVAEQHRAVELGWRAFRIRSEYQPLLPNEVICPASKEAGYKSTCQQCKLCSGTYAGDVRKSVAIIVHGTGKKNFVSLDSIGKVA